MMFVVVCCCLCCLLFFVLFVQCSGFALFCFSCFQLCRMFLYRLITNATSITKHKTNKHACVCCCVLLCVLFVVCVVCSCLCVWFVLLFLFPTMPHVPLQVNTKHSKHNKTRNKKHMYVVCCCVLFCFCGVCSCLCVCVVLPFLVSNYAACSFIGYNENNKHNKTQNKTNVCCLLLFVVVCDVFVVVLSVHVYVFVVVVFSCFQLCNMFLYRLITNITNITRHKKMYVFVVVCCCV